MKKIILIIIVILIVAVGGYFVYNAIQGSAYKAENQQQNQTENLTSAVTIENYAFNPATLTIKEGTAVIWTNQDSAPHQIKSNTLNSAVLKKGENFQFTFSVAGEYDYLCSIHPSMKGRIIVTK